MSEPTARIPPSGPQYRAAVAATTQPVDAARSAVRLGAALRALNRTVVGTTAPDDLLDEVAGAVDQLTARLEQHAHSTRFEQANAISGRGTFVNHPMIGPTNPCAPRIEMRVDGERLVGHVSFGTPQEGPPGCGYGGYIAAGFDAILLMTAGINGLGGPTRSLTIRYRRPTPLNTPLRYLGHVDSVEERNVRLRGELVDDRGTVYAEGTAEVATGTAIGRQTITW